MKQKTTQNRGILSRTLAALVSVIMVIGLMPGIGLIAKAAGTTVIDFAGLQSAIAGAPTDGTEYVIEITQDLDVTAAINIPAGANITLTNDGTTSTTLLRDTAFRATFFSVPTGAQLTIENLALDGNKASVTANASLISNSGTLTISDGVQLFDNKLSAGYNGGGIYNDNAGSLTISGDVKIHDNTTGNWGGGIYNNNGTLTVSGSANGSVEIYNNTAPGYYGGGILNYEYATATISDGVKIFGNSAGYGSGIDNFGALTISGSANDSVEIYDNTATSNGGGIELETAASATCDISGNVKIYENKASNGAGIENEGTVAISSNSNGSVEITDNEATSNGGGILSYKSLTISGSDANNIVKISGNTAVTYNAGGIGNFNAGNVDISGNVEISGNTAPNGGGIYNSGSATISGSDANNIVKISDNTASSLGGGIYNYNLGSMTISDNTEISGNTSTGNGGGIYMHGGSSTMPATATISGDNIKISGNTGNGGGGVMVNFYATCDISGSVEISGNTSTTNGGGITVVGTFATPAPAPYF